MMQSEVPCVSGGFMCWEGDEWHGCSDYVSCTTHSCHCTWAKHPLTLLPTAGGDFLAHAIRLAARTLEPCHIESAKFLTSLICLWTHCGKISGKLICQGVAAIIYGTRSHEKYAIGTFVFLFKMAELLGGDNLGSGKQLLTIKVSFCINRSGSWRLMVVWATCSLPGRLTFIHHISKNRTAIF